VKPSETDFKPTDIVPKYIYHLHVRTLPDIFSLAERLLQRRSIISTLVKVSRWNGV
jgi:hypothetical protein